MPLGLAAEERLRKHDERGSCEGYIADKPLGVVHDCHRIKKHGASRGGRDVYGRRAVVARY